MVTTATLMKEWAPDLGFHRWVAGGGAVGNVKAHSSLERRHDHPPVRCHWPDSVPAAWSGRLSLPSGGYGACLRRLAGRRGCLQGDLS